MPNPYPTRLLLPLLLATLLVACRPALAPSVPPLPSATPSAYPLPKASAAPTALVTAITDGDTIQVLLAGRTYTVRYIGIDTPETIHPGEPVQPYGKEAAANRDLVLNQTVRLERDISDTDQYGRLLSYVWLGDLMINAELIRLGFAQASTVPPDVKYQARFLQLQTEARAANRGLWSLPPATPTPTVAPSALTGPCARGCATPPPGCAIKGNIGDNQTKIYHLPNCRDYNRTLINPAAGERWFCTEDEARANGWRKALNCP